VGLGIQLDDVVVAEGELILVEVGSQDIINGASAMEIDASMIALWQEIKDRGGEPVATLIAPSNSFPGSVVAVNNQIRVSAQAQGIQVLDLTSPVAAIDGTWAEGFSDDGQQANAAGTAVMSQALVSQLARLPSAAVTAN
jgi:hypothetical protein